MNRIKRILIENVKGKKELEVEFNDLYANKPNLLVAFNGFGKSTIAQAFSSIKPTKIELKNDLLYSSDATNEPKVEVEFEGDNAGIFVANNSKNDFNSKFDVKVINNAVVAKSSYSTAGAHLKIEPIVIYKNIPQKKKIDYSLLKISQELNCSPKNLINLNGLLEDINNLNKLLEIELKLFRASNNKTSQHKIEQFISKTNLQNSKKRIISEINDQNIDELLSDNNVKAVFNVLTTILDKQTEKSDIVLSVLQLIIWYKQKCSEDKHFLRKIFDYKLYEINRKILDNRLAIFNTTGRVIKTKKDGNSLVVNFYNATSMSNGERDVLVFIAELFRFEIGMKHNNAILIIDEIFDYLDGSNLLVAQYYLSSFIDDCKKAGKIIFPILFTHLDPQTFNNYYFKDKKIHYLIKAGTSCLNSDIVKIIKKRNVACEDDFISKYLLHYTNENIDIPKEIKSLASENFPKNINDFKALVNNEVIKYIKDEYYNPILVTIGIRIKVEEIAYNRLPQNKKIEFINTHSTIKKLNYAKDYSELEEILFLLQPIYNDPLHLSDNDNMNKTKINSCAIKLYSNSIKNIIRILFSIDG